MILIAVFAALFLLVFAFKKHTGTAILAAAAGGLANNILNSWITDRLSTILSGIPAELIGNIVCLVFVLVLPLVLLSRSSKGTSRVMRWVESIAFATLIISLLAGPIKYIFMLDSLSTSILGYFVEYAGVLLIVGLVVGYADVLIYKSSGD